MIARELYSAVSIWNTGIGFRLHYDHRIVYLHMLVEMGKWWVGESGDTAWLVNRK